MRKQKLKVTDDDGIIAIVNPARYNTSLPYQDQWTWGELRTFFSLTNRGNLIIWESGMEAEWTGLVADKPSKNPLSEKANSTSRSPTVS